MSSIDDAKTRILSRVPLSDLIGDSIKPQRRSGSITGLCPFHAEKSPSFHVYGDHYHCFGCRAHGDAISYVQKTQGLGFIEALRWLAGKYGIEAPELDRSSFDNAKTRDKAQKSKILMAAQDFFVQHLSEPHGKETINYLHSRGFTDEKIKEFGFGYAPKSKSDLANHLRSMGFKFDDVKDCSLANGDSHRFYDFFQDRVMVPIRDLQGRLLAFGGRTMSGEPQKYKNSRYDKGSVLFGMDKARKAMRSSGRAIVVEGYMDALQMWQHGFDETVACQGTALTQQHMHQLKNATDTVYLMFDGDSAGRAASLKLIEDAIQLSDVDFRVAALADGEDPDSYSKKFGKEGVEKLLEQATDLIGYCISVRLKGSHSMAVPELISKDFVPWLSQITDPIKKDYLIAQLSKKTGVAATAIHASIKASKQENNSKNSRQYAEEPPPPDQEPSFSDEDLESANVPLSPLGKELLGHIYFSDPDGINAEELATFIQNDLGEAGIWEAFALEMVHTLKSGNSPYKQDVGLWSLSHNPLVSRFLQWAGDSRELFACGDRKAQIRKLELVHKQDSLKKKVSYLKDKLTVEASQLDNQNDWQEIIQIVSQLNGELKNIQSELANH